MSHGTVRARQDPEASSPRRPADSPRALPGFVRGLMVAAVMATVAGCAAERPVNPSFDLTMREARVALDRMAEEPVTLDRPVVVLDGWMDPGLGVLYVAPRLARLTGDDRIVSVAFLGVGSFEQAAERVFEAVDEALTHAHENAGTDATPAVDVVAISMGGLVARYAAMPPDQRAALKPDEADGHAVTDRRLNIARLFTISAPHRGAAMAPWAPWDAMARQMRAGSPLLEQLDAALAEADYPIRAYVRLGDRLVGEANAAPTDRTPWWVPTAPLSLGHSGAHRDPRLLADILARLRGERPFTREPPAPLPEAAR